MAHGKVNRSQELDPIQLKQIRFPDGVKGDPIYGTAKPINWFGESSDVPTPGNQVGFSWMKEKKKKGGK